MDLLREVVSNLGPTGKDNKIKCIGDYANIQYAVEEFCYPPTRSTYGGNHAFALHARDTVLIEAHNSSVIHTGVQLFLPDNLHLHFKDTTLADDDSPFKYQSFYISDIEEIHIVMTNTSSKKEPLYRGEMIAVFSIIKKMFFEFSEV